MHSSSSGDKARHHRAERIRQVSLVRALVGICNPSKGTVRLDGAALDHWQHDLLGRHIGYVPRVDRAAAGHDRPEYRPLRA